MSRNTTFHNAANPRHEYNLQDPIAADVIAAFNTWAFKREQPSDLELLRAFVDSAIEADSKVPFVLYWGKGPRSYACSTEASCLDFLSKLARRVKQVYPPGVVFDLVFTDTHARLNGHSERSMEYYFHDVAACADPDLFRSHRLSNLVCDRGHETETFERPSPEMLDELEKSACKWFGGRATPRQAAATYFALNMRERRAIETAFPRSVFITFNGSKLRPLFPTRLPIFYMHSIKKGVSVKPWFMPDPDEMRNPDTTAPMVAVVGV